MFRIETATRKASVSIDIEAFILLKKNALRVKFQTEASV